MPKPEYVANLTRRSLFKADDGKPERPLAVLPKDISHAREKPEPEAPAKRTPIPLLEVKPLIGKEKADKIAELKAASIVKTAAEFVIPQEPVVTLVARYPVSLSDMEAIFDDKPLENQEKRGRGRPKKSPEDRKAYMRELMAKKRAKEKAK